jgi:SAM-dependent methyltransferase
MYSISANEYDLTEEKHLNYQKEAKELTKLIKTVHPKAKTILDVACGTGEHALYLGKRFQVDGLDINRKFVVAAREKNPIGRFYCADMRKFSLRKKYDVITCLYAAIGFAKTISSLQRTIRCFEKHLNDNGVIIVNPWLTPNAWVKGKFDGKAFMTSTESEKTNFCLMNRGIQKGRITLIEIHYLFGSKNGVRHITNKHDIGLFTVKEMKTAFKNADLKVTYEDNGITKKRFYIAKRNNK